MTKPHFPRFVRLAAEQLAVLFGPDASLQPRIEISGGRFVARQRLAVVGKSGRLDGVAVVGPVEPRTTLRLAPGDTQRLGLDSGSGVLLVGPHGEIRLTDGIQIAS